MSNQHKTEEPILILKQTLVCEKKRLLQIELTLLFFIQANQPSLSARIVLSDEEDEDALNKYTSDGDNDDDDPITEPMSAEALELLQTEKVLKAGYLLKKGEKRRVRFPLYNVLF